MVLSNLSKGFNTAINNIIYTRKKTNELDRQHLNELKLCIEQTRAELHCAMENFDNVIEPKLIDFYIYKIQSEQTRYDQLICEYKLLKSRI